MTDWCLCNSGVKQGDNLLPILFSIFIDDLVDEINELGSTKSNAFFRSINEAITFGLVLITLLSVNT
jgi:uncharacterized membrane protein